MSAERSLPAVHLMLGILNDIDARVRWCDEIDAQRDAGDARALAHVDHHPDVICVAHDLSSFPMENQAGILLHEIGHLLDDGDTKISDAELTKAAAIYDPERVPVEAAANQQVLDVLGIEILYDEAQLQYVTDEALASLGL